ncbi:MAG: GTP cyclohydrolase II, partial [Mucinivorans sp.]
VLRRAGHTEAGMDLTKLAGLQPGAALIEIMNADGTMARMPQLMEIADEHQIKIISIADLIAYRLERESLVIRGERVKLPTVYGDFDLIPFYQKSNGMEHVALIKGEWEENEPILVRMHSSCMTGDIFGSCRCDCGDQLHQSMQMIESEGKGVIVYLAQEGRGIGLFNKIKAYKLQDEGLNTVEANIKLGFKADERDYGVGANILREIGAKNLNLLTNNPLKRVGLEGYGIRINKNVPIVIKPNLHNLKYLQTKERDMGHKLGIFTNVIK